MKTIILIDSGYLKCVFKEAGYFYSADNLEEFCLHFMAYLKSLDSHFNLLRILFYDCLPYQGKVQLPISKKEHEFVATDNIMHQLEVKKYFAVRYGTLKFRGFTLKKSSYAKNNLTDEDFEPSFEQKGVDMRIGLDISQYSHDKTIDQIILISNDTDCIPAMKNARKNGLKMALLQIGNTRITNELKAHSDEIYSFSFPTSKKLKKFKPRQ